MATISVTICDQEKWFELSRDTPFDFILSNPNLPWDARGLAINPTNPFDLGVQLDWEAYGITVS